MARRRTRKQRGGGGGQSKGNVEEAAGGGGGGAAAPAPVPRQDPEEEGIVSIIYLLTLLRGEPVADEPVYRELLENKKNLTSIVIRLEGVEDGLRDELEPIERRLNAERRNIQGPLARVRRGSFTENNVANRQNANRNVGRLNRSENAETARRLRGQINGLYTKTIRGQKLKQLI
jgi:hypothetical protein